jgi:hypothetical protein
MAQQILKLKARRIDFDAFGTDPERWSATASHLLATARLAWQQIAEGMAGYRATMAAARTAAQTAALEERVRYRGPFFLLAGLAIENQVKALIVARQISSGEKPRSAREVLNLFPNGKHQHNLVRLAGCAQVQLSDPECTLLTRLSSFVMWAGRYPIPKNESDARFERTTGECDLREVEQLIEKLRREVIVLRRPAKNSHIRR